MREALFKTKIVHSDGRQLGLYIILTVLAAVTVWAEWWFHSTTSSWTIFLLAAHSWYHTAQFTTKIATDASKKPKDTWRNQLIGVAVMSVFTVAALLVFILVPFPKKYGIALHADLFPFMIGCSALLFIQALIIHFKFDRCPAKCHGTPGHIYLDATIILFLAIGIKVRIHDSYFQIIDGVFFLLCIVYGLHGFMNRENE